MTDADVVVIGAGAMGAATAWQLARAGRQVHLFEQFEQGHVRGASHGASRNFNVAYDDELHLAWLREARALWAELEAEAHRPLLTETGIVNHGPGRDFERAAQAIRAGGFGADVLDASEASARWPGFRFDGPVMHNPGAGRLDADASVAALVGGAAQRGAVVRWNTRVTDLVVTDADAAALTVEGADGVRETVHARRVVVTAGAWTSSVLAGLDFSGLPPLRVTQEQPAHFAVRDAAVTWPGFNHIPASDDPLTQWFPTGVYGMLTPGQGVKAGWHAAGPVVDPDRRSFVPDPALTAQIQRYAREWLPGVDADVFTEITCTYTSTPDAQFYLERVGPVIIGAGFSGHGFKFTPVIGRILADRVQRG